MTVPVRRRTVLVLVLGLLGFGVAAGDPALAMAPTPVFAPYVNYPAGRALSVAVADFTGDGRHDVVVSAEDLDTSAPDHLYVFVQGRDGWFERVDSVETELGWQPEGGVAAGDLDGDGLADAAVATGRSIHLFPQRAGRLVSGAELALAGVRQVEVADVDGDGRADLIGSGTGGVSVLAGLGTGQFAPPVLVTDRWQKEVQVGDVTGDGRPDIVACELWEVLVFGQRPGGGFAPPAAYPVAEPCEGVAIADVDGDGRPDVSTVLSGNRPRSRVVVLSQRADGTLSPHSYPTGDTPGAVKPGDMNGDGLTDLVVLHEHRKSVGVHAQAPDRSLDPERTYLVPYTNSGSPKALAVGDVNGDRRTDIVVASGTYGLAVLWGQPAGPSTTTSSTKLPSTVPTSPPPGTPPPTFSAFQNYDVGGGATVATGDFDGDGRTDVAMSTRGLGSEPEDAYKLFVFHQGTDGSLARAVRFDTDVADEETMVLAAGDLDGDGRRDLVLAGRPGINVFMQRDGTFADRKFIEIPVVYRADLADMDADGKADLVVTGADGVAVHRSLGAYRFAEPVLVTPNAGQVAVGDVTGDGRLDVVTVDSFRGLVVHRQSAEHTFSAGARVEPGGPPGAIAIGDLDGDGRLDVAVSHSLGPIDMARIRILLQGADGSLAPHTDLDASGVGPIQTGDVDGDGRTDLVTLYGGSEAGTRLQQAGGQFGPERRYPLPYATRYTNTAMAVADFTGDRRLDVAIADYNNGLVVLRNASSGVPPVPAQAGRFVPLSPSRVLDTRAGVGAPAAKVGPGATLALQVAGRGGVPASGVSAVALNLTVVDPTVAGYVTAWPSGEPRPLASNVNFAPGQTVPNLVVAKVGADGKVALFNSGGSSHLVADVVGWYGTGTVAPGTYGALAPQRLLDTRSGLGAPAAKVPPGGSIGLQVTGRGGVPATGVSAVVLNVTITDPASMGYLTAWPSGEGRPLASNLNFASGQTVANLVVVKVGAGGKVDFFNGGGSTHVVADVAGWFAAGDSLLPGAYSPVVPSRLLDTRAGVGADAGKLGPGASLGLLVVGRGGVPATGVAAVVLNVTVVDPTSTGYLTAWPTGEARPLASNLNFVPAQTVPNLVVVKVGMGGKVDLFNNAGSSHVVADVAGWYAG